MAAFTMIASLVLSKSAMSSLDARLSDALHQRISQQGVFLMSIVTNFGATWFVLASAGILGTWLYQRGCAALAFETLATVTGATLLNEFLKLVFQRPRPHFENAALQFTTYSFPSGHTTGATVLFGFIFLLSVTRLSKPLLKAAIGIASLAAIVTVGFSRLYLGAHFVGDVLGGMAAGIAWLCFCRFFFDAAPSKLRGVED